jgi:hypothetical protein
MDACNSFWLFLYKMAQMEGGKKDSTILPLAAASLVLLYCPLRLYVPSLSYLQNI